jgi:hypothetical protein
VERPTAGRHRAGQQWSVATFGIGLDLGFLGLRISSIAAGPKGIVGRPPDQR